MCVGQSATLLSFTPGSELKSYYSSEVILSKLRGKTPVKVACQTWLLMRNCNEIFILFFFKMKKIATLTERKSEMEEHGGNVMEEKEEDNNK